MKQGGFFVTLIATATVMATGAVPVATAAPQQRAIVVTSTADPGPGTLREALERATPGTTITFEPDVFPPDDPETITITSALPSLTQGQVTIDASNAGVILEAGQLPRGDGINRLVIASDGNVIRGLQQNGVQTLLILIVIFGLATLILWLLFPLRLGTKRGRRS